MSIPDLLERGKAQVGRIPRDAVTVLVLILSSTAAYGLGVLTGRDLAPGEGTGFRIEEAGEGQLIPAKAATPAAAASAPKPAPVADLPPPDTSGPYVASRTGEKYYLIACGSAKRIKEENRVYFKTKDAAEAKGYAPAANCPGL
jgi:hypothetical protein